MREISEVVDALTALPSFSGSFSGGGEDETVFEMQFSSYNAKTGLFTATGLDKYGSSAIVGAVEPGREEIRFSKVYRTSPGSSIYGSDSSFENIREILNDPGITGDFSSFRTINYKGKIIVPDKKITLGGDWKRNRYGSPGIWRLESLE